MIDNRFLGVMDEPLAVPRRSRRVPIRRLPISRHLVSPAFFTAFLLFMQSTASAEVRSLKLFYVNTGERAEITYKRDGHYIPNGLKAINHILRDWRQNKETTIDPRVIDLLWEVYQKSGSRDYIRVLCGYRTPTTNAMLRNRSRASGVAKESQHILGKAIDFALPDVPLEKVREIGMKFQVGGVGYYPHSASPFVHMDTGGVRAWPRMSRQQLVRLFPNGRTLHLPPDGRPLPGYQEALADYRQRVTSRSIMVAGSGGAEGRSSGGHLLAALFHPRQRPADSASELHNAASVLPGQNQADTNSAAMPASDANLAFAVPERAPVPMARPLPLIASASKGPTAGESVLSATPIAGEAVQNPTDVVASIPVPTLRSKREPYPSDSVGRAQEMPKEVVASALPSSAFANAPLPLARPTVTAYVSPNPALIGRSAVVGLNGSGEPAPGISDSDSTGLDESFAVRERTQSLETAALDHSPSWPHEVRQQTPAQELDPTRFATVSGAAVKGARLPHGGDGLTSDAIFHWASAKARAGERLRSAATGHSNDKRPRLQLAAQAVFGIGPEAGRADAVSVVFPND